MSRTLVEQRRLQHRGREFHFVSYEGRPADAKRSQPATGPAWWLMSAGTRWEVMPFNPGGNEEELEHAFRVWLDANAFTSVEQGAA
jgi:hypothetical protein